MKINEIVPNMKLDEIVPLTNQDIFNLSWQRYAVEKKPVAKETAVDGYACVYRGNNDPLSDVRCIIGNCIPNEMYTKQIEGRGVIFLYDNYANNNYKKHFKKLFSECAELYLTELQQLHDSTQKDQTILERDLRRVARKFKLTIPE